MTKAKNVEPIPCQGTRAKTALCILTLAFFQTIQAHADTTAVQAAVKDGFRRGGAAFGNGVKPSSAPVASRPLPEEGEAIRAWLKHAVENDRATNASASSAGLPWTHRSQAKVPPGATIHWRDDGMPRRIQLSKGIPGRGRSALLAAGSAPKDRVVAFVEEYRDLFRLTEPTSEITLVREENDTLGMRHFRFEQRHQGLRVMGREMLVHMDVNGHLASIESTLAGTPNVPNLTALLGSDQAVSLARARIPGGNMATNSTPELVVHAAEGETPRLAWSFDVVLGIAKAWRIVVDAETGKTLSQESRVMHESYPGRGVDMLGTTRSLNLWRNGSTYYLIDASKPSFDATWDPLTDPKGAIAILDAKGVTIEDFPSSTPSLLTSSSPNSWPIKDGVSASYGFSQVHDYYRLRHGRSSYDDKGATMLALVRIGGFDNAFWNGAASVMVFGNARPYVAALDVIGHEVTHGVVERSAALVYQNQSGALNEAFADIMGEMVEAMTLGAPDWKVGSRLGQPIRDMQNPAAFGQPGTMSGYVRLPNTDAGDHGGVHLNSGIINRAFYLVAAGLDNPVGLVPAERIFYRALTRHLLAQSQFVDARLAAEASAAELYGVGSPQALRVAEAFDAVGIVAAPSTAPPSSLPTVAGPQSYLTLEPGPTSSTFNVWRYEAAQGDGSSGRRVAQQAAKSKPSVDGAGTFAIYVTASHDLAYMPTDGKAPTEYLQRPGLIHSVSLSPNGRYLSCILRDQNTGNALGNILLIDLVGNTSKVIDLVVPVVDGATIDAVEYADTMTFSADSTGLIYDFLSVVRFGNAAPVEQWSIAAVDIETLRPAVLIPPLPGIDIGNPSLARTSNRYLVFEAIVGFSNSSYTSYVVVGDLFAGDAEMVRETKFQQGGLAFPSFTGDDTAVVFTAPIYGDTTSVWTMGLTQDRLHALNQPSVVCGGATIGVPYRRGTFIGTNSPPSVSLGSIPARVAMGSALTLAANASDPDGSIQKVEFYDGATLIGTASGQAGGGYSCAWIPKLLGAHRLVARAIDNLGGVADSSAATISVTEGRPSLSISSIPGSLIRVVVSQGDGAYDLQQSSDLKSWTRVASINATPTGSTDLSSASASGFYFRLFRP